VSAAAWFQAAGDLESWFDDSATIVRLKRALHIFVLFVDASFLSYFFGR
jgi:hypothetical protein